MFLHGDCGGQQINQTHRQYRVLGPESPLRSAALLCDWQCV